MSPDSPIRCRRFLGRAAAVLDLRDRAVRPTAFQREKGSGHVCARALFGPRSEGGRRRAFRDSCGSTPGGGSVSEASAVGGSGVTVAGVCGNLAPGNLLHPIDQQLVLRRLALAEDGVGDRGVRSAGGGKQLARRGILLIDVMQHGVQVSLRESSAGRLVGRNANQPHARGRLQAVAARARAMVYQHGLDRLGERFDGPARQAAGPCDPSPRSSAPAAVHSSPRPRSAVRRPS